MPDNPEENEEEQPTPNADGNSSGEILELEKAAKAGDIEAQKRLAEIAGVESYEQYISLRKKIIVEIQAADSTTGGILRALNEATIPIARRLSGLFTEIQQNVITAEMQRSLRGMADAVAKLDGRRMQEITEETRAALGLASMPWVKNTLMFSEIATQPVYADIERLAISSGEKTAAALNVIGDSILAAGLEPTYRSAELASQALKGAMPSAAELLGLTVSGKDLLAAGKAPDLHLDFPSLAYAYVSPQERVADELAESNRLQREILAEIREQRIGKEQNKRRWALARPQRIGVSLPDKPIPPKPGSTLDVWFDYYHALKKGGYKITFKALEEMSGYAENTFKQAHARYKLQRGIGVPDD